MTAPTVTGPCVNCGRDVELSEDDIDWFFEDQTEDGGERVKVYFVCKVCYAQIFKDGSDKTQTKAVNHFLRLFLKKRDLGPLYYIFSDSTERGELEAITIDMRFPGSLHRAYLPRPEPEPREE